MNDSAYNHPFQPQQGAPHAYGPNLVLHSTPYPLGLLARLGHPDAIQPEVGQLARRLYEHLFVQIASTELALAPVVVPTRMTATHPEQRWAGHVVDHEQRVVVADVARAGILGSQLFYERFNEILDPVGVRQDHLFVSRRVDGHGRVIGADIVGAKIGGPLEGATLVIPDPMGATGGSLLRVLDHYAASGAGRAARVVFAHLIVTPEYVRRVHAAQPDVRIHAIRLDRGHSSERALANLPGLYPDEESGLDAHQYVVPGAGGLGEVLNNAWV